jgi:hypothetical protein
MYRVKFIYAPIPDKYFKSYDEAIAYKNSRAAASVIEKKTFFGNWKKVLDK